MPKAQYIKQDDGTIYCPKCKQNFEESHFQIVPHATQPSRYVCKIGNKNFNEGGRNRRKSTNHEYGSRDYQRFYTLIKKFGITETIYTEMFQSQNGVCAICKNPETTSTVGGTISNLCVDHETGQVRGLLCIKCNSGLGQFKDSIKNLLSSIEYLNSTYPTISSNSIEIPYSKNSKDYFKERALIKFFNMNLSSYKEILKNQDFCCKICEKPEYEFSKSLSVDHCHKTGKVRGLLCSSCNKGLGLFSDDELLFNSAIDYLLKFNS